MTVAEKLYSGATLITFVQGGTVRYWHIDSYDISAESITVINESDDEVKVSFNEVRNYNFFKKID